MSCFIGASAKSPSLTKATSPKILRIGAEYFHFLSNKSSPDCWQFFVFMRSSSTPLICVYDESKRTSHLLWRQILKVKTFLEKLFCIQYFLEQTESSMVSIRGLVFRKNGTTRVSDLTQIAFFDDLTQVIFVVLENDSDSSYNCTLEMTLTRVTIAKHSAKILSRWLEPYYRLQVKSCYTSLLCHSRYYTTFDRLLLLIVPNKIQ